MNFSWIYLLRVRNHFQENVIERNLIERKKQMQRNSVGRSLNCRCLLCTVRKLIFISKEKHLIAFKMLRGFFYPCCASFETLLFVALSTPNGKQNAAEYKFNVAIAPINP